MFHINNKLNRFSIRKYSVGVASVIIGAYFLAQQQAVSADQVVAPTTSDAPTELVTEATPVGATTPVSSSETASNDTLSSVETKSKEMKEVSPEVTTLANEVATADKVSNTQEVSATSESSTDAKNESSHDEKMAETTPSVTEKLGADENKVVDKSEPAANKDIDPTNPQGLKTVGYAAANVDEPSFDTTRIRSLKKDGSILKEVDNPETVSPDVDIKEEGYVSLRSAGNGAIGDNYTWKNYAPDSINDTWGYPVRECTSFVAFRLGTANGLSSGFSYLGNGGQWGDNARARGYRVDNTPARGSVAYFNDGGYGHVAWVAAVEGSRVLVEEYNWYTSSGLDHDYHVRYQNANQYTGFIHFKDLDNSSSSSTSTDTSNQGTPASGTYRFTGRASIKSEPKMSSPELAHYDAGQSVNYDRKLEADGHEWISYISFSGNRRYIAIRELAKPVTPSVSDKPTGTIAITNNNSTTGSFDIIVSNVWDPNGVQKVYLPTWSEVDGQDDIIWYTATRQADGTYRQHVEASEHKNSTGTYNVHMYYVENNGELGWGGGTTTNVQMSNPMPNIPSSGVYHFTGRSGIKSEPKMSSTDLAYYDAGETVNYDKVLSSDGHAWISYISYSGNRRYIAIN